MTNDSFLEGLQILHVNGRVCLLSRYKVAVYPDMDLMCSTAKPDPPVWFQLLWLFNFPPYTECPRRSAVLAPRPQPVQQVERDRCREMSDSSGLLPLCGCLSNSKCSLPDDGWTAGIQTSDPVIRICIARPNTGMAMIDILGLIVAAVMTEGDRQTQSHRQGGRQVNITVRPVPFEEKPVLRNLIHLYLYDMSEFDNEDVGSHGLFEYKYLDHYWTEADRHAFFIEVDGHLAGFVLVNRHSIVVENANTIAEFFVMKKYRRKGIGSQVAREVFDRLPGEWEIRELYDNTAAHAFWRSVIGAYTSGQYQERIAE